VINRIPDFSDKKTARLWLPKQVCVKPEMLRQIKVLADLEDRSMQDQIRHLLKLALKQELRRLKVGLK
jgi:hypothetical protein